MAVTAMPAIQYKGRRSILEFLCGMKLDEFQAFGLINHQKIMKDHVYLFRVQKLDAFSGDKSYFRTTQLPEDKPIAPESLPFYETHLFAIRV